MRQQSITSMKLSTNKELKREILGLPQKEKDKLLLRLVGKDKVLTEHLHFLLLEGESDLIMRVEVLKKHIVAISEKMHENGKSDAKETLSALRKLATQVNHNFRVTRAAFEDVELRLFLLLEISTTFKYKFFGSRRDYEQVFYKFYLTFVGITLNKYQKLHEDLQFDLKEDLNKLLKKIYSGKMSAEAKELKLPASF